MKTQRLHNHRAGFTLVELLVYIGLVALVALLAGNVLVDTIRMKQTTENKMTAFANANEAIGYLEADLMRLGAKSWMVNSNMSQTNTDVYWDSPAGDFSSFGITDNALPGLDRLTFRAGFYDPTVDTVQNTRIVSWWVDADSNLWRQEQVLGLAASPAVLMISGVTGFNVEPGVLLEDSATSGSKMQFTIADSLQMAANGVIQLTSTVNGLQLTNFPTNVSDSIRFTKRNFTFEPGVTYGVRIKMNPNTGLSTDFNMQTDTIKVGFRSISGTAKIPGVNDYMMFPGQITGSRERVFRFTQGASTPVAAMLVMNFHFGPLISNDTLTIDSIKIWRDRLAQYQWLTPALTINQKNRTKGLRIDLRVVRRGEESHMRRIISTPNNGV